MVWRSLSRRRVRTAFTLTGIAAGTWAYLLLVGLSQGIVHEAQAAVDALGIDLVVQSSGTNTIMSSRLSSELVSDLANQPGVRSYSELVIGTTQLDTNRRFWIFGIRPDQQLVKSVSLSAGRLHRRGTWELAIGQQAARLLDIHTGDRVAIVGRHEFDVVGTYRTGRSLIDNGAVIDLAAAQEIFKLDGWINAVFLNVVKPNDAERLARKLRALWPDLEVSPADGFATRFEVPLFQRFARALAIIALLMAALGVSNTLLMNVAERRGEIGLLRALGWRRSRLARLILGEGLLLALLGGLIGLLLSEAFLRYFPVTDFLGVLPQRLAAATVVEGLAAVLGAGILASALPLLQSLRVRPASALRGL